MLAGVVDGLLFGILMNLKHQHVRFQALVLSLKPSHVLAGHAFGEMDAGERGAFSDVVTPTTAFYNSHQHEKKVQRVC